jgi:MOSC domain-containing protein YiiM
MQIEILEFYISPGHNFKGYHGKPPGENPVHKPTSIECVENKGINGDRFFEYKENFNGQITFFEIEVFEAAQEALQCFDSSPEVLRRNVLIKGVDLNSLIDQKFQIGECIFLGTVECAPCYWMDQAFAPGMEEFLKGRGGLRAKILQSGSLVLGKQELLTLS